MALILSGRALGYVYAILGGALALVIRPDELVMLAVAFAMAMIVRGLFRQGRAFRPLRIVASAVVVVGFVVLTGIEASHFVHAAGGNGLSGTLNAVSANNQGVGAGFGSSTVTYSSNPLYYLRDVYTVLFDPLPFLAHSVTQLAAAAENTLILVVIVLSFRQLRCLFRVSLQRPYVFVCLVYSLVFMYAFAALGNLGLITRERTLLLPFLFVLLSVPLAPEGQYPYPWQLPRNRRRPIPGLGRAPCGGSGRGGVSGRSWTMLPVLASRSGQPTPSRTRRRPIGHRPNGYLTRSNPVRCQQGSPPSTRVSGRATRRQPRNITTTPNCQLGARQPRVVKTGVPPRRFTAHQWPICSSYIP